MIPGRKFRFEDRFHFFGSVFNPLTPVRFSNFHLFSKDFSQTLKIHNFRNFGRGKLGEGSIDAKFHVDSKTAKFLQQKIDRF